MRLAARARLDLGRHLIACCAVALAGCAEVGVPQGCTPEERREQVVEPGAGDEATCVQFSIDATQEPGTFGAPIVQSAFPFDPANAYRISVLSTSTPWRDGPVPATPERGWSGWRSMIGAVEKWDTVCPRARMYQAVCAPSGAIDHCQAADGNAFHPDAIGAVTCFANDRAGHYRNNSGCVAVRVCKLR